MIYDQFWRCGFQRNFYKLLLNRKGKTLSGARILSSFLLCFIFISLFGCYHEHTIEKVKNADGMAVKTLVIALDGIDYELMSELHREGYFKSFSKPAPMISTFPSGTTLGFTGIFQSLANGKVQGYESRFYSFQKNKVVGGSPWDVYKYLIHYKLYFDYFRHKMSEKAMMYAFPSMAGQYDLMNIRDLVMHNPKQLLFAYLGGTDGSAHMLGRSRTKRFLIQMSRYLDLLKKDYETKFGGPLKIIMFADHGFHYGDLHTIWLNSVDNELQRAGFKLTSRIESEKDVLVVKYGLLSAAAFYTPLKHRREIAQRIAAVKGIDLVFWQEGPGKVFIQNSRGEQALFEYKNRHSYRYSTLVGDPLLYREVLKAHGFSAQQWISDADWLRMTAENQYPDVGRRLYDSFFQLVESPAAILVSTQPDYQIGPAFTIFGTYAKFGQKGTHGGIFRQPSLTFAMTNDPKIKISNSLRYDQFFKTVLPAITSQYSPIKEHEVILPSYNCCK